MSSSKRVLLVASFAASVLDFRGQLIAALQASGADVHVAVPDLSPGSSLHHRLLAAGLVVHHISLRRTGVNPMHDLNTLVRLWQIMRQLQPDIVMSYTAKPVIYGTIAAWLAGIPHRFALISGLGYAFQGEGRRKPMRRLVEILYASALKRAHKVFFQNPDDRKLFIDRGVIPSYVPSVVVNGSGVDLAQYPRTPLPEGPLRFLMIGRLLGDKGVREYAHAAKEVRARHPETCFALAGWIDENPDAITQSELDEWTESGTIVFHGRVSNSVAALANCSVYVLPSYREGTPRTVLEAMAMGRPIITTDAPGCRETVVNGENGYLVPVKSVDGLVAAMERLILSPSLVDAMGRRSLQIATEKYDVHKVNAVMLREMAL